MNQTNLKMFTAAMAVICVVAFAFTITVTTYEAVPDHARFLVNTKERYIVPRPVAAHYIFHPLPNQSDDEVFAQFDGSVLWGEIKKKDHPYHDFGLPKTPEWDRFVMYGRDVSIFRSLVFPPPSRWDEEGNWRY